MESRESRSGNIPHSIWRSIAVCPRRFRPALCTRPGAVRLYVVTSNPATFALCFSREGRVAIVHSDAVLPVFVASCACHHCENLFVVCASDVAGQVKAAKRNDKKIEVKRK